MGIGSALSGMFGRLGFGGGVVAPTVAQVTRLIGPPRLDPTQDHILSDVYSPPYRSPYGDLDRYGNETPDMRRRYLDQYRAGPVFRSAVRGKADDICCLQPTMMPADKDDADSARAAKFFEWAVNSAPGGFPGLIDTIYTPGSLVGYSLSEPRLKPATWQGHPVWGLAHVRGIDTTHIRLQLDVFRNVVGVVNVLRGLEYYDPGQVLLYTHNGMFSNPFGQADSRAAIRAADLIDDVYKVWYVALKVYGLPYMKGKVGDATRRKQMEAALRTLREGGWVVLPDKNDEIEVLNLAAAAALNGFEAAVHTYREDIFFAVRGAAQPFMEGDGGADAHTDTSVQQEASNAGEKRIAGAVADVINRQLVPWVIGPNKHLFGNLDESRYPWLKLGGTNWKNVKEIVGIIKDSQEVGGDVSAEFFHDATGMPAPRDDNDRLVPASEKRQQAQQQQPGAPAANGGLTPPDPAAIAQPPAQAFSDAAKPHKFATVLLPLSGPVAAYLRAAAARIPDADLADRGREDEPHVTARFGLHAADPAEVVPLVRASGPLTLSFDRPTVFRGAESGKPYDVIKLDVVRSPELLALHDRLAALPHTDTFPEYRPHATIAYVRAGMGDHYADRMPFPRSGLSEAATRAVFSDRDRVQTVIPLGDPAPAATFSADHSAGPTAADVARAAERVFAEVGA